MTAHDHSTLVPGCYRCELNKDEMGIATCSQLIYGATLEMPAEYCDEECDGDSSYCAYHTTPDLWDKADEAYSRMKEGNW